LGGQAAAGLPLAYTYGASKLQESLPMSLIGEGGLSDQNPYFGAMGVSVDPTVEEILRYGDEGKPSPDTGEGSTLASIWDALKNEFGGSAEAADLSGIIPKNLEKTIEEGIQSYKKSNEISPALQKLIDEGTSYNEWDMIPSKYNYAGMTQKTPYKGSRFSIKDMKNIGFNLDEDDPYVHRIPDRIRGVPRSIPRNMGMLEKLRNRFYKPAAGAVKYGGQTYSPAQLNSMNALGGYYSGPAREQRQIQQRGINVLNRAAAGKPVGNVNQLLGQYGYKKSPSGGVTFTGGHEGSATAGAGYSRSDSGWSSSPFRKGGLATLWPR